MIFKFTGRLPGKLRKNLTCGHGETRRDYPQLESLQFFSENKDAKDVSDAPKRT
jgi:hypothetical protein